MHIYLFQVFVHPVNIVSVQSKAIWFGEIQTDSLSVSSAEGNTLEESVGLLFGFTLQLCQLIILYYITRNNSNLQLTIQT